MVSLGCLGCSGEGGLVDTPYILNPSLNPADVINTLLFFV